MGLRLFNASMILAMMLKLTTIFVVIPALPSIADEFGISLSLVAQLATVYEAGKLTGALLLGALADRMNKLTLVYMAMSTYVLLAGGMVAFVFLDAGPGLPRLLAFATLYFFASMASIASQLGLGILKQANPKDAYKGLVVKQSVVASVFHAFFLAVSASLVQRFGWRSPFVVMGGYALIAVLGLRCAANQAILDSVNPLPKRNSGALPATEAQAAPLLVEDGSAPPAPPRSASFVGRARLAHASLCARVSVLLCDGRVEIRRYRGFVAALGAATATMYTWPTVATLLLQRGLALSKWEATCCVVAPFALNAVVRLTSLFLLKKVVRSETFVTAGVLLMLLGSSATLVLALATPMSTWTIVGPGFAIMTGVALTMPHCKAGAMDGMPDEITGAAVSMLKLVQVVVPMAVAFSAASTLEESSCVPLGAVLLTVNVLGALAFALTLRSISADSAAVSDGIVRAMSKQSMRTPASGIEREESVALSVRSNAEGGAQAAEDAAV